MLLEMINGFGPNRLKRFYNDNEIRYFLYDRKHAILHPILYESLFTITVNLTVRFTKTYITSQNKINSNLAPRPLIPYYPLHVNNTNLKNDSIIQQNKCPVTLLSNLIFPLTLEDGIAESLWRLELWRLSGARCFVCGCVLFIEYTWQVLIALNKLYPSDVRTTYIYAKTLLSFFCGVSRVRSSCAARLYNT